MGGHTQTLQQGQTHTHTLPFQKGQGHKPSSRDRRTSPHPPQQGAAGTDTLPTHTPCIGEQQRHNQQLRQSTGPHGQKGAMCLWFSFPSPSLLPAGVGPRRAAPLPVRWDLAGAQGGSERGTLRQVLSERGVHAKLLPLGSRRHGAHRDCQESEELPALLPGVLPSPCLIRPRGAASLRRLPAPQWGPRQ